MDEKQEKQRQQTATRPVDRELVEKVQACLVHEEYDWVADDWRSFVPEQKLGWCRDIARSASDLTARHHPGTVEHVRGIVQYDRPAIDGEGERHDQGEHQYIAVDGVPYDFAKGTLMEYVDYQDEDGRLQDRLFDPLVLQAERYDRLQGIVV